MSIKSSKRVRHQIFFNDSPLSISRTKQADKESTDINYIMRTYNATGIMHNVRQGQPMFGDFVNVPDYETSLNQIRAADAAFMSLDAKLRKRFDNDPAMLLTFLEDVSNRTEAIALGLISEPVQVLNNLGSENKIPAKPESGA